MAIGRISGSVLKSNLTRNGVDLAFETNLLYLDVTNSRVGIGTSEPATTFHVNGTIRGSGINVNNAYTLPTSDGSAGQQLTTDGSGNVTWADKDGSADISISGNVIKTTLSNSNLELSANGTGNIVMNAGISTADSSNVTFNDAITANTGTSQFYNLQVNNEISLGGAGSQYLAYNEDSVKVKFANWYSSNARQYGQGQLWYEMFFAAVDSSDTLDRRRIGFYLDTPNKGASNAEEGSSAHPNNHRAFIDNDSFTLSPKAPLRFEEAYDDSTSIKYTQLQGQSALSANRTITLPDATGTVVLQDSTDTLSNKTLTSPVINGFSGTGNGSMNGTLSITTTTTDDSLLITTTEDSSSAAPVITLKRNSSSPADADYLGQIKFKGENDADQEVVYAKITGKIQDASDGTEDGLIEFANRKAGSNTITARLRSDSLQLLNDTNLSVAGTSTLTGATTIGTSLVVDDNIKIEDDTITTTASNSNLNIGASGTGTVSINGFSFPTSDGTSGQVLTTNGAGQFIFETIGTSETDTDEAGGEEVAADITGSQSVINSFSTSTYDSAFYFLVTRDEVNQTLDLRRHSLTHNTSDAFVNTFGQVKSDESNSYITVDADINSGLARLLATGQSVSNSVSLYRIVLGGDTSASEDGNVSFIVNNDVDSAIENLDTWSTSSYRGAQYFISATDPVTNEASNIEALVVTDGTDAYVTSYGNVNTGNSDLLTLSADVFNGDARLRATASRANVQVKMYRILLSDSETSSIGTSVNVVGATTVSSASTTLDSFTSDDYHGAMYLVVANNSSEGASSVSTVYMLNDGSASYISVGPQVSSKATDQLTFSTSFSGKTATLSCSSTSGGSTTVNAYRIHLKRGSSNTVTTNTDQTISGSKTFTSAIVADTIRSPGSNANITLDPQGTGSVVIGSLSTNNALLYNAGSGAIGESSILAIDEANERLGIGTSSPSVKLDIVGESSGETQIRMAQHNTGSDAPDIRMFKSRGTESSPTAVANSDNLAFVNSFAYDGSSYVQSGAFGWTADGTDGDSKFIINTRVANTTATRLTIDADGDVSVTNELTAKSIKETVNALSASASIALDPTLGGIQTITLGQATTFTLSNWASGHRMTLMIDDGSNYAVTWPTMQWAGGVAPTLATSGYNTIELWYVGSTLYGAYVGAHS